MVRKKGGGGREGGGEKEQKKYQDGAEHCVKKGVQEGVVRIGCWSTSHSTMPPPQPAKSTIA